MASAFDELANKIPQGDLGKGSPQMVTDFLGRSTPGFSSGQPALPTGAAPPAPSTGPSGPSGTGSVGQKAATGLLAPPGGAGGEVLQTEINTGGGGGTAPGEGSPTGQGIDVAGGPANIGLSFGVGPGSVNIGPTGTISVGGARGDATSQGIGSAITAALNLAGVPTSVNLPSLVAALTSAPALGIAAQLAGAAGAPLTLAALAHAIASMSPTSVTNLQAALADPNPEAQLSLAQAMAVAAGGAKGPTQGGPQAIGNLPFDNPVTNVNASTQAAPTTPALNLADMFSGGIFGTNREDVGPPAPPNEPADITATGDVGIGGAPTGGPPGGQGETGGGTSEGEL